MCKPEIFLFFNSVAVFEFNLAEIGDFKETVEFIAVKFNAQLNILAGEKRCSDYCKNGIVFLFNALDFNVGNIKSGNINFKSVFAVIVKNFYFNFA